MLSIAKQMYDYYVKPYLGEKKGPGHGGIRTDAGYYRWYWLAHLQPGWSGR